MKLRDLLITISLLDIIYVTASSKGEMSNNIIMKGSPDSLYESLDEYYLNAKVKYIKVQANYALLIEVERY